MGKMRAKRRLFYLDGLYIEPLEYSQSPVHEYISFNSGRYKPLWGGETESTLSCRILVPNYGYAKRYLDFLLRHGRMNLGILGSGHRCHHCGEINITGTVICWRCGGSTERYPFLRPRQFPFEFVSSYTWDERIFPSDDELHFSEVQVDLVGYGKYEDMSSLFQGGDLFSMPLTHRLNLDLYLCNYCGQAVREGEICPGCGGERRPWAELMTIEHTCYYCGQDVRGGIVCPGCGARIRGETFRVFQREGIDHGTW